jgi:hypothetical protein
MGECADLKLVCEEVGVHPDLKTIAHGDFRRCRGSSCLGRVLAGGVVDTLLVYNTIQQPHESARLEGRLIAILRDLWPKVIAVDFTP